MSFQPIGVGTLPNDHTGDPLRDACVKINQNFVELYTAVALAASDADITAAIAEFSLRVAAVEESLAGKADASAVALKANLIDVIIATAVQGVPLVNRTQFALNSGTLVCIPFELMSPSVNINPEAYRFILPRLPQPFIVKDAFFTVHDLSVEDGDVTFTASMTQSSSGLILQATASPLTIAGLCPVGIPGAANRVNAGELNTLDLTVASIASLAGDAVSGGSGSAGKHLSGLTLWLRGVWGDGPVS